MEHNRRVCVGALCERAVDVLADKRGLRRKVAQRDRYGPDGASSRELIKSISLTGPGCSVCFDHMCVQDQMRQSLVCMNTWNLVCSEARDHLNLAGPEFAVFMTAKIDLVASTYPRGANTGYPDLRMEFPRRVERNFRRRPAGAFTSPTRLAFSRSRTWNRPELPDLAEDDAPSAAAGAGTCTSLKRRIGAPPYITVSERMRPRRLSHHVDGHLWPAPNALMVSGTILAGDHRCSRCAQATASVWSQWVLLSV
jgi:hypothetical protein